MAPPAWSAGPHRENWPLVGIALRDRAAHDAAPTCGMVLSFGAHLKRWDMLVPASREGKQRHAACGPSGRVPAGGRRSQPFAPFS